jgi:hypothetical protein
MRRHPRRAEVNPNHPQGWGTSDRNGHVGNLAKMKFQYDWAGAKIINKRILVHEDELDIPQRQLGVLIIPPDPLPLMNARPESYATDEYPVSTRYTMDGRVRAIQPYVIATTNPDPFTKILLHFTGISGSQSFGDEVGNVWTAGGTAVVDGSTYEFAPSSFKCDGSGYISTPNGPIFTLGSADFTIDCWFNCQVTAGTTGMICSQEAAFPTTTSVRIFRDASNRMIVNMISNGSVDTQVPSLLTYTDTLNTGWHHIAAVRAGPNFMGFIDGVKQGSVNVDKNVVNVSSAAFFIGAQSAGGLIPWHGWIDEFRFSPGIARWTSPFQPPITQYTLQTNLFSQYPVERIVSIPGNLQP